MLLSLRTLPVTTRGLWGSLHLQKHSPNDTDALMMLTLLLLSGPVASFAPPLNPGLLSIDLLIVVLGVQGSILAVTQLLTLTLTGMPLALPSLGLNIRPFPVLTVGTVDGL